ncbi:P-loop containing nucleoside triphosphate hydrolase protein [Pilaira anomala]|nr:P-loop containing nucleoside triphosphate hydrolase protein [Pilaira anomala]
MESPSSNNNILMENSQLTDTSTNIGEWLAYEEASLEDLSLNHHYGQTDHQTSHGSSEFQWRVDNNRDELMQNKVSFPVVANTKLRPIGEIPSPYNSVFKFGVFNVIQSKCLNDTFYENNNLVISAPTGSGKTVLMELAIIRTLLNHGDNSKIIYMAPTKSLCSERAKDWEEKFRPFGIECKEFTGDTHFVSVASIRKTSIIITTPEKWDSMTRRWIDNKQLMQLINLFLIDEVHILNEKRGACLEACVSRMQTMGHDLRYIAVSATVPNVQDIATWLKAKPITFSEEYRPIKLERFVYGYPLNEANMFLFDRKLDWKLLDMIEKHSNAKPVLIFCSTRYQEGGLKEYSDIDLLQMIGRAGRPGLDTSGSVVILTTSNMEGRYNALISGTTNIESQLHENLIEHLTSEICLGTIKDIHTALTWLRSTFLYVRLSQNPIHYRLEPGINMSTDSILQEICVKDLELLKEHNLIEETSDNSLKPTPYGLAMDRYYIKFPTMVRLLSAGNPSSVKDTLSLLSESQEEMNMIRFNNGEKPFLNALAHNPDIRFPIDKVSTIPQKIFILIQCVLANISLYNAGNTLLVMEASNIQNTISRIIDCSVQERNPIKLKFAVELYQSLQAKMWSTSPYIARQIEGIGLQHAKTLAKANMISMEQLRNCDPGRIEMILNRNPPFGTKIKKHLETIPHFILNVEQSPCSKNNRARTSNEFINLHVTIGLANAAVNRGKYGKAFYAQFSVDTSDKDFISNLHQSQQKFDLKVEVTSSAMTIICNLRSEDFVGVDVTKEIKPNIDPKSYISLAGSSLISAQANEVKPRANKPSVYDDALEDYDISPSLWQEIDSLSLSSTASAPKHASNLSKPSTHPDLLNRSKSISRPKSFNQPDPLSSTSPTNCDNSKKKQHRKKKNPGELCKHKCKNKETCAHACCKLHVDSTPIETKAGIKRVHEDDLLLDSLLQKKLKPSSQDENVSEFNYSHHSNNHIPFNNTQQTSNAFNSMEKNNLIGNNKTQENNVESNDDDLFMDFLEFDEQDIESINKFEFKLPSTEPNHQYQVPSDFPIMVDVNNIGAFSDPCDLMWQQAGEYVQQVFEQSPSTLSNESSWLLPDTATALNDNYIMNSPVSFQSPSLADWIYNYVDIIYDDKNL